MEAQNNKRGRKKTKDRVSTAIMIDRDLYEWTVGKNRSDIVNSALRFMYKNNPSYDIIIGLADKILKAEDEAILRGDYLNPNK